LCFDIEWKIHVSLMMGVCAPKAMLRDANSLLRTGTLISRASTTEPAHDAGEKARFHLIEGPGGVASES
jgi:hypothetical protein